MKIVDLWQGSIFKKGCIWDIMILKKGSWEIKITSDRKRVFDGA